MEGGAGAVDLHPLIEKRRVEPQTVSHSGGNTRQPGRGGVAGRGVGEEYQVIFPVPEQSGQSKEASGIFQDMTE
jgi:hypothetical protein